MQAVARCNNEHDSICSGETSRTEDLWRGLGDQGIFFKKKPLVPAKRWLVAKLRVITGSKLSNLKELEATVGPDEFALKVRDKVEKLLLELLPFLTVQDFFHRL